MPADHCISLCMLDTGKRYHNAHAAMDKEDRQNLQEADAYTPGAPHLYAWCTLILLLIKSVEANKLPPHLVKDLAQLKATAPRSRTMYNLRTQYMSAE
eukprot:14339326-Heterocapsa_arctica.AAC.1